jgi:purine-nucleoside phosphorylase
VEQDLSTLVESVRNRSGGGSIALAIVLGSGLGGLVEQLENPITFPYSDFPCFPPLRVAGHQGQLILGRLDGLQVLLFQGRYHVYQGLTARQAALPARVAKALGVPRLLLTNAVGGINPSYQAGDFIYVADHLNFLGDNPLRGETVNPFIDLCRLYRQEYYPPLADFAVAQGIGLHRGVLAAMAGPSYETPAEIRALALLGADAVTMSTIPEAILSHYLGLEVVALSFVANAAAGQSSTTLDHQEVLAAGAAGAEAFALLVRHLAALWAAAEF